MFVLFNKRSKLKRLKSIGEYSPKFDAYSRLCRRCWERVTIVPCDLCKSSLDLFENHQPKFQSHLAKLGVTTEKFVEAQRVCADCAQRHRHYLCSRCEKPFPRDSESITSYRWNKDIERWLAPYHPDYQPDWKHLCPDCLDDCCAACKAVESRVENWVGCTKGEYIRDYKTVEELGRVDCKGTDCDEPAQVEDRLRLYAAQLGGNGVVKYYWEKQVKQESERVLAGHGPRGNPYYRTETTREQWFTGYATAVHVEPFSRRKRSSKQPDGAPRNQQVKVAVVDGLNICCWGNQERRDPDLRILLTLCSELLRQKIRFVVFFDANTPHLLRERKDEDAATAYGAMVSQRSDIFIEVPGRMQADEFLLQRADSDNAHVISNDQFRDYTDRYSWLTSGERLLKGTAAGTRLTIPRLEFDLRIMPDAQMVAESMMAAMAKTPSPTSA